MSDETLPIRHCDGGPQSGLTGAGYPYCLVVIPALQALVTGFMALILMGLSMTLDCYDRCPSAYRRVDVASLGLVLLGGGSVLAAVRPRGSVGLWAGLQAASFVLAVLMGLWGLGVRP